MLIYVQSMEYLPTIYMVFLCLVVPMALGDYPCPNDEEFFCKEACQCQDFSIPCNNTCQPMNPNFCPDTGKCNSFYEPCNKTCLDDDLADVYCSNLGSPICSPVELTRDCNGECIFTTTPCDTECTSNTFYCDSLDECVYKDRLDKTVWFCNDTCVTDQWHCEFDPPCKSLSVPCEFGQCPQGYWYCNLKCYPHDTPCLNDCPPGYIVCDGKCKSKYAYHICNGKCLHIEQPCDNRCSDDDEWICKQDTCTDFVYEECLSKNRQCNGECDSTTTKCGPICLTEDMDSLWECGDECISAYKPCEGECKSGYYLCGGRCMLNSNHGFSYNCGEECIGSNIQCNGHCNNYTNYKPCGDRMCIEDDDPYWTCENDCIYASSPCDGKCLEDRCLYDIDHCYTWACDGARSNEVFKISIFLVLIFHLLK